MKYLCLISVELLCDYGFAVNFDAKHVYLRKGILILVGNRDPTSVLLNLTQPLIPHSWVTLYPSPWTQ